VTLKSIVSFLFFTLLSVYFAFLNPHEVDINFTQSYSLHLPMVVMFLGSVLLGVLIAGLLHGTLSIKTFFSNLRVAGHNRRQDKTNHRVGILFEKAENLVAGDCVSKAIPVYEKILNLSPNHVSGLTRLGNRLREEGDSDRALELHLKAVQVAPENLDVLYGLANDYSARAMHQEEMATLEKIQKLDRKSPRVLYRLREAHLKTEDWALAGDVQRKLISVVEGKEKKALEKRTLSRYIYNNGVRYFMNGNFDAAVPEFKKAIREDEQSLSAHIMLGDACLETGNGKAALKAWKAGYENTNSPVCLMRMEKFYRESGRVEEMVKIYREAIKNSQNSTRETLSLLLGSLYLEEGNPQETIQAIEENTDSQKAIIPSLILANAYKQQLNEKQSQDAVENASHQVRNAILKFQCKECGGTLTEWVDSCPACNAFGKIECRPGVDSR